MANELKMAIIQAIQRLHALRWSNRRIARELGIDRGTVGRYVRSIQSDSNAAIPPAGCPAPKAATFPGVPAPPAERAGNNDSAEVGRISKPAISPAGSEAILAGNDTAISPAGMGGQQRGSPGRPSHCEPFREVIQAAFEAGLSAQRIWQDLVAEHGFAGGYDSVKRFLRRSGRTPSLPFRRLECLAGEEAQVDFGSGAPVITPEGKRRKTHVFRIVLSHSRKAYSEATFTQSTDDFLRALENAFRHFGAVPKTLVIDNLKAAVAHPDWFDPELVPKVQSFCHHYGTVILPTRVYMPRHKGKVESSVKYVKNNALKARSFASLADQNRFLLDWETTVADTRIHGTTRQQVGRVFTEVERGALLPLPLERFALFHEAQRKVNRDGHVEVAKAYYSVPPEYLGRTVWVRFNGRVVRVFNHRWEQIALHVQHEQGRFSTQAEHIAREKISGLEKGATYLLNKVSLIGPETQQWAEAMLAARGIEGTRVLQGLLGLTKKYSSQTLEKACQTARSHAAYRLRTLRKLLVHQAAKQAPLPFLEEHPIIRPLDDYAAVVAQALHRQTDRSSLSEGFTRHGWTEATLPEAQQKSLAALEPAQSGFTAVLPPRSGYPLPGCSSAEPDSVSPDPCSVVPSTSLHQESSHE